MAETLRLALVGCGAIAKMHLVGIRAGAHRDHPAVDPDEARAGAMAAETGAEAFSSLEAALAVATSMRST